MFVILNRLRGTKSYFAKVTGAVLGLFVYMMTDDVTAALLTVAGYILGESFGWGKWIGGIINNTHYSKGVELDREGRNNGIHFITELVVREDEDYQKYCNLALGLRGFYWAFITLLPLFVFGYVSNVSFLVSTIALAAMFPLSVHIGKYTATKFQFNKYGWNMIGPWEHAEVWYGVAMDLVLIALVLAG